MSMREKDQADFDLERFIEMFDEAMTSQDPRVIDSLRNLMMIVALTRPEAHENHNRHHGPLRRLFEDMHTLNSRMQRMQDDINNLRYREQDKAYKNPYDEKFSMKAAVEMAQSIDADVMQSISRKINTPGGIAIGSNLVQPKGLLDK